MCYRIHACVHLNYKSLCLLIKETNKLPCMHAWVHLNYKSFSLLLKKTNNPPRRFTFEYSHRIWFTFRFRFTFELSHHICRCLHSIACVATVNESESVNAMNVKPILPASWTVISLYFKSRLKHFDCYTFLFIK